MPTIIVGIFYLKKKELAFEKNLDQKQKTNKNTESN